MIQLEIYLVVPPVPVNSFYQCTYHDADPDTKEWGYGKTVQEAIDDFVEQYQDHYKAAPIYRWK